MNTHENVRDQQSTQAKTRACLIARRARKRVGRRTNLLPLIDVCLAKRRTWAPVPMPVRFSLKNFARRLVGPCIQKETQLSEWEYRKIDLNQQRPRSDELDMLNTCGADGWELVAITSNNVAYLKRPIEELVVPSEYSRDAPTSAKDWHTNGNDEREGRIQEVKAKYRDPTTNETWSGRGRMANWLKRKQEAGEDIHKYLV
jgi:hypothetical protein